MGKTGDLVKKIGDSKGIFHARMGTVNTETVWTKQRQKGLRSGGENTQRNLQKRSS